jgi:hypothetical protein
MYLLDKVRGEQLVQLRCGSWSLGLDLLDSRLISRLLVARLLNSWYSRLWIARLLWSKVHLSELASQIVGLPRCWN